MKIPFDIKYRPQIESGEYGLVTRTGWPVRIICWDYKTAKKKGYKLIGLIESKAAGHKSDEFISFYYNSGKCERDKESAHDLFILTPEPELTEFEEMLYSIFNAYNGLKIDVRAAVDTNAKTLLELAKKEICKGCTVSIDSYIKGREQKEQKPEERFEEAREKYHVEWSEEDVKRLYSIGTQIGFLKGKYSEYQKDIDWLYALAEKMGFHKCKIGEVVTEWKKENIDDKMLSKSKQEWSEEDKRIMDGIQLVLESWDRSHSSIAGLPSLIPSYISWLKSLRPSWKPSEDEESKK